MWFVSSSTLTDTTIIQITPILGPIIWLLATTRSGAVRLTIDLRIYRRYEEITRWSEFVKKYFPELEIPKPKKERQKLHKLVAQTPKENLDKVGQAPLL